MGHQDKDYCSKIAGNWGNWDKGQMGNRAIGTTEIKFQIQIQIQGVIKVSMTIIVVTLKKK